MPHVVNIAAYKFVTLDRLDERREQLREITQRLDLRGTILLSEEGINSFLAGSREAIDEYLSALRSEPEFADLEVKESFSDSQPFSRMLVRVKKEIIAFGVPGIDPRRETSKRISAAELKEWLDEGRPIALLDVRNDYEVALGTFENATAIGVDHFRNFPEAVHKLPQEMRDKPVVTFCTGGIRCEKAGPFMEAAGFTNVYQLDGGILKYFEDCGGDHYDGDCFVFDKRVALDPGLNETSAQLCFACLSPLSDEAQLSEYYVAGESCPYCYQDEAQAMRNRIEQRHAIIRETSDPLPGSQPYENRRPMNVPGRFDGASVAEFLQGRYPEIDAADWETLTRRELLVRGENPVQLSDVVRAGEQLVRLEPDTIEPDVSNRIEILFEDEYLVVANKPAPLPMHPCGRYNRNTLSFLLEPAYRPQRLRPLHRLDANTCGVVVFGRTRRAARLVQPQFEADEVRKTYIAVVSGHPDWDILKCQEPIAQAPGPGGTRTTSPSGLPAETNFRVLLSNSDDTAVVEARPVTGRTNQIRIHLAALGHPVIGDPVYGHGNSGDEDHSPTLPLTAPPMRLFARSIAFEHPDGHSAEFESPVPDWLAGLWPPTDSSR